MTTLTKYALLLVMSSLISSLSQVLLKKSAGRRYDSKIKEYLNAPVIIAYGIFFLCTLISMYGLKVVPLSMSPLLDATGYIFVTALSFAFFKEVPGRRQLAGLVLILAGIAVYGIQG
ncbi:MAG: EamA family transporter [Oscillospiraceae bacterium]|nr:EamA family transporter [Oscillospiraceae bacterium]